MDEHIKKKKTVFEFGASWTRIILFLQLLHNSYRLHYLFQEDTNTDFYLSKVVTFLNMIHQMLRMEFYVNKLLSGLLLDFDSWRYSYVISDVTHTIVPTGRDTITFTLKPTTKQLY